MPIGIQIIWQLVLSFIEVTLRGFFLNILIYILFYFIFFKFSIVYLLTCYWIDLLVNEVKVCLHLFRKKNFTYSWFYQIFFTNNFQFGSRVEFILIFQDKWYWCDNFNSENLKLIFRLTCLYVQYIKFWSNLTYRFDHAFFF